MKIRFSNLQCHPLNASIKKGAAAPSVLQENGAPWGIRTLDVLIRSQTLYPAEVTAHIDAAELS